MSTRPRAPMSPRRVLLPLGLALLPILAGCAYLLPASARAFHADPDDAAPAITRALDQSGLSVATFDQVRREIATSWVQHSSGVARVRERFVVRWEREPKDDTLVVSVRHEAEEQDVADGAPRWGATYHDRRREEDLLERIEQALEGGAPEPPRKSRRAR